MIKAIIIDCFGVLATDGWLPFKKKYFSANQKLWDEASNLNKQADAGFIGYPQYVRELARLTHLPEPEVRHQIEHNIPDEALFEFIQHTLKPTYKLAMLSNAGQNWLDKIFTKAQIGLFDEILLSYEIGFVKPDPRAYQLTAKRLGVEITECLFIDDQERYCLAAQALGMSAIIYESLDQLQPALKTVLKAESTLK